jgi:hypothetical protein
MKTRRRKVGWGSTAGETSELINAVDVPGIVSLV